MRILRKDLSQAATSSLPLLLCLCVLNGWQHAEPLSRIGIVTAILASPFLALAVLLDLPVDLRPRRGTVLRYGALLALGVLWVFAVKTLADGRAIPQARRLAFAVQTVSLVVVFMVLSLGGRLYFADRRSRQERLEE